LQPPAAADGSEEENEDGRLERMRRKVDTKV